MPYSMAEVVCVRPSSVKGALSPLLLAVLCENGGTRKLSGRGGTNNCQQVLTYIICHFYMCNIDFFSISLLSHLYLYELIYNYLEI